MVASSIAIVGEANSLFGAGLRAMLHNGMHFSKVFEARSYAEILMRLEQSPSARLLTVDFAMPGMRDADRLRQLRLQFPQLRLAVVSDSLCRDDMLLAITGGAHGYVPTSLCFDDITRALNIILSGKIYVPVEIAILESDTSLPTAANDADTPTLMSVRQREVIQLIARGNSNKLIARALNLSEGTVKAHVSAAYRKMGVNNRASAAAALSQIPIIF